jgi:uncharacterized protein (UPF0333 family)
MAKFRINRTVFLLLLVLIIIVIGYVYSTSVSNKEGLTWKGLPGQNIDTRTIQSYDNVVNAEACQQHCINNNKCVAISIDNDPSNKSNKKNVCKLKSEAPNNRIYKDRHHTSFLLTR